MTDPAPTPVPPPKKKRFQFKHRGAAAAARSPPEANPSAAKAKKDDSEDDSLDLFRRSKEFFPKAIEDRQRRVQAKKERRKAARKEAVDAGQPDQKRRRVSVPADEDEDIYGVAGREAEKPKISAPADDDDVYGVSDREEERRAKFAAERASAKTEPATPCSSRTRSTGTAPRSSSHTARRSPPTDVDGVSKSATPASPFSKATPEIKRGTPAKAANNKISLLSSDEDEPTVSASRPLRQGRSSDIIPLSPPPAPAATTPPEDDDDLLEPVDPEFEKYIIQARKAKLQQGNESRKMQVVVTSRMGDGPHGPLPPLVAMTLTSKPLGIIRTEFIKHARRKAGLVLPPDQEDSVLLTWKKLKIYDVSTGISLQVGQPNEKGLFLTQEGYPIPNGTNGFQDGRMHFEVWFKHIYNNYLKYRDEERDRKLAGKDDDFSDDDMAIDGVVEVQDEARPVKKLRLTLKSRAHEPVKLSAEEGTEVAVLVAAFRTQRAIGSDQRVSLQWDGETLDEATTLAEADIGDEDTIDVHIS